MSKYRKIDWQNVLQDFGSRKHVKFSTKGNQLRVQDSGPQGNKKWVNITDKYTLPKGAAQQDPLGKNNFKYNQNKALETLVKKGSFKRQQSTQINKQKNNQEGGGSNLQNSAQMVQSIQGILSGGGPQPSDSYGGNVNTGEAFSSGALQGGLSGVGLASGIGGLMASGGTSAAAALGGPATLGIIAGSAILSGMLGRSKAKRANELAQRERDRAKAAMLEEREYRAEQEQKRQRMSAMQNVMSNMMRAFS